jgi:hypothetical protein
MSNIDLGWPPGWLSWLAWLFLDIAVLNSRPLATAGLLFLRTDLRRTFSAAACSRSDNSSKWMTPIQTSRAVRPGGAFAPFCGAFAPCGPRSRGAHVAATERGGMARSFLCALSPAARQPRLHHLAYTLFAMKAFPQRSQVAGKDFVMMCGLASIRLP